MPKMSQGIVYAGEPTTDFSVASARVTGDHIMLVTFSTGETRLFDASGLLSIPVYRPLQSQDAFCSFHIDHGILTWENGAIDIAPEELYRRSFQYEKIA